MRIIMKNVFIEKASLQMHNGGQKLARMLPSKEERTVFMVFWLGLMIEIWQWERMEEKKRGIAFLVLQRERAKGN